MTARASAMLRTVPFEAPAWAAKLASPPTSVVRLRHPSASPIYPFRLPESLVPSSLGFEVYIKRDDFSGVETSGNKIRKLEFLMAAALDAGADSVVTIGGVQSNHARATVAACRMLGLEPHVILRTGAKPHEEEGKPEALGLSGNLLVSRLLGAHVHLVTRKSYATVGSDALVDELVAELSDESREPRRKPYGVPVGGSNALGTWGYLNFVTELQKQCVDEDLAFDDIVMACGSGGTTAGIALGVHLSKMDTKVHAFNVCDSAEYFYKFIGEEIMTPLGAGDIDVRSLVDIRDTIGKGYAQSTQEELRFVADVARSTGVILDPVYSGKALFGMVKKMQSDPGAFKGKRVLFVHTGGLLGMYDKEAQLQEILAAADPTQGTVAWRAADLAAAAEAEGGSAGAGSGSGGSGAGSAGAP